MTSCGYIFPSGPGDFLFFLYWLTAVWTSLSVRHTFMWSDFTFWVFLLPCFCLASLWCFILTGGLHLHSYQICKLPICMSPYLHSLSRLLQLSNCPRHSIVWQVSKASDNPFNVWQVYLFYNQKIIDPCGTYIQSQVNTGIYRCRVDVLVFHLFIEPASVCLWNLTTFTL